MYLRNRRSTVTRLLHISSHKGTRTDRSHTQHWALCRSAFRRLEVPHRHRAGRFTNTQKYGMTTEFQSRKSTGRFIRPARSGAAPGARGAAHAPASILVRPPRGYHCNMAATHFLAEVLRWFLLLISTTAFFVTVPNSCGFTALILIHILKENRER